MPYYIRGAAGDTSMSVSWVRNKNGAGECEYTADRADALGFPDLAAAQAYVASEKRAHAFEQV